MSPEGNFAEQGSDPYAVIQRINGQSTTLLASFSLCKQYKLGQVLDNLSENQFCHL